jgi:hypothetical protein
MAASRSPATVSAAGGANAQGGVGEAGNFRRPPVAAIAYMASTQHRFGRNLAAYTL